MVSPRKADGYYGVARTDMVPWLPDPVGRALDVGCGSGATGRLLADRRPELLVGVEIDAEAAELARDAYDEVHVGSAQAIVANLDGEFDTILCYDVLEHLVDPWAVLEQLSRLSAPGARLHVSVPNARHLSLLFDVALRGTFGYAEHGHRDDTHLRWFTPGDIERAVRDVGFDVQTRGHPPISPWRRALARLTADRSTQFLVAQWQLLATKA